MYVYVTMTSRGLTILQLCYLFRKICARFRNHCQCIWLEVDVNTVGSAQANLENHYHQLTINEF